MITNLQISVARGYANLKEPTHYEEMQLVKIYMMLDNNLSSNPMSLFHHVRELRKNNRNAFDKILHEAKEHFRDKTKIE